MEPCLASRIREYFLWRRVIAAKPSGASRRPLKNKKKMRCGAATNFRGCERLFIPVL
jgi:hypothetical protein